jgi:hypothetical protein
MANKDTFYFSHDYNSRNDPRMVSLLMKVGIIGHGIYWCIVEMLYEQGGYINLSECERIAFELRTETEIVRTVIASNLFKRNESIFWSESVIRRLNERKIKSVKARESANIRWSDANAFRKQSDPNAIKERKGKERKIIDNGNFEEKSPEKMQGVRIDEENLVVHFPDGSTQPLGINQKGLLEMKQLKPKEVFKGLVN